MGHGVAAALTATLCVGSLRNARNEGASLLEQAAATNTALAAHAHDRGLEDFVTGLIGRVDLRTGCDGPGQRQRTSRRTSLVAPR